MKEQRRERLATKGIASRHPRFEQGLLSFEILGKGEARSKERHAARDRG